MMGGWRKSSRSMNGGNCAEVGAGTGGVLVRDTADRGGPVLTFPAGAWVVFTGGLTGARQ